jgi:hypothetical protein
MKNLLGFPPQRNALDSTRRVRPVPAIRECGCRSFPLGSSMPEVSYRVRAAPRGATRLQFFQPARYFFRVLPAVECRNANVTFALRAKTGTRCDDDIQHPQHSIEHLPAR